MNNWPDLALEILSREPVAMITLAATEGSTPREAGARMLITPTQTHGTVGGGNLEFLLIDQARRLLDSDLSYLQQDYPLGPLVAQCCGGHVRVLIKRLDDASREWLETAALAERTGAPDTLTAGISGEAIVRSIAIAWPASATEGAAVNATRRQPWTQLTEKHPPHQHAPLYLRRRPCRHGSRRYRCVAALPPALDRHARRTRRHAQSRNWPGPHSGHRNSPAAQPLRDPHPRPRTGLPDYPRRPAPRRRQLLRPHRFRYQARQIPFPS